MAIREGRFKGGRAPGVPEFTASIGFDRRLYRHDIAGSKAHATMLAECGIIPAATAKRIVAGLAKIERRIAAGDFAFTVELEDIHMHIEHALIAALGDEGARLHTARSRNDQIALDIRLWLREEIDAVDAGIRALQRALVAQGEAQVGAILPGFTHLQHAQPVLLAHHLLAYVEMAERDRERLADCRRRVNILPLGAGALAGTTLPINRERVAELLGFPKVAQNSMDAVADRDFVCEALAALSILMMHISRLGEDIILWCTPEFGFAEPGDDYCTGSSLMPQKKNPDLAEELVRGGMPFRVAHQRVGALVRHCRETGRSPESLSLKEMQKIIPEATAACIRVFSPESSVAGRELTGGTGPQQVKRQLAAWKKRLAR
jgi:argininosuccinate lyase